MKKKSAWNTWADMCGPDPKEEACEIHFMDVKTFMHRRYQVH